MENVVTMKRSFKKWGILFFIGCIGIALPMEGQGIAEVGSSAERLQANQSQEILKKPVAITESIKGLENVLAYIEQQTEIGFVYRQELVKPFADIKVTKNTKSTVGKLLDDLLGGIALSYVAAEDHIIITEKEEAADTKQEVVTGIVREASSNEPLPTVNVRLKGSTVGTASDKNGEYRIIVPSLQDTLIFTYIGFQRREIPIDGRKEINVMMESSISEMSEVVVTGIVERDVDTYTGSSVMVNNEELRQAGGNDNIIKALQNIDPSFVVVENLTQGSNPNVLPEMQLRGTSTFPAQESELTSELKGNYLKNPNQPLFILDGFEASVEEVFDLDVDRVRSVTILKDASAKALYGSQAANGVVVIETKKLSATDPIITYNVNTFVEAPDLSSYNLTNAAEKLEAERIDGVYQDEDTEDYIVLQQLYNTRKKRIMEGLDTDWMAKPLRTAFGQNHSLTVELGTDDLKLLGGIAYGNDQGVMKESHRKNISGNIKASYRIDNFLLRNNLRVNKNSTQNSPFGDFSEYSRMNPYWRAENPDGAIPYYAEIGIYNDEGAVNQVSFVNPLYNSTLNSINASSYLNFTNNFYLEWKILPELKTTARLGISTWSNEADEFYPAGHTRFEDVADENREQKGSYQLNEGERNSISGDLNVNYSNQIGKHFYLANAGFNIREENYSELYHLVEGFPSERLNDPTFGRRYASDSNPRGIDGVNREIGFLFIGSYMYDERYLTDLTLRTNASSQFGTDKRWANFWSFGLGWNLHNESFMESQNVVDRLKLRGSLGSTGNQNFRTNVSISTYSYYLDSFYDDFIGSYTENMANPGLQWESKFDYNIGFDADIAGLSLKFDYYESYTENLVTDLSIPSSTGFTSVKENVGRIKNRGFEVNASYLVYAGNNGFLSLNVGVTTNKNEIIDLSDAMRNYNEMIEEEAAKIYNSDPVIKYEDGRSMNDIWAVPSLGIDPATGNEIYLTRDGNTTFEYNPNDMVVVGNSSPDYRGIFGFNGEYKGFGLNMIFRFKKGGQMYNQTLVNKVENIDINYNVDRRVLTGRWKEPGDISKFKRLTGCVDSDDEDTLCNNEKRTRPTSRFVQDLSQLDIAAVSLYYNFPQHLLDNFGARRLRLGVNMNDVATFSTVRIERGTQYPFARRVSFSLSATF